VIRESLLDPFNVLVLGVLVAVGIIIGHPAVLIAVGAGLYLVGAARIRFGADTPQLPPAPAPLEESRLTPGIARLVRQARARQQSIHAAVADNVDLPGGEVLQEVDGFVLALEGTARRAQALADALRDTGPDRVAARLGEVRGDPAKAELADALRTQLETSRRMQAQLNRFGDEMERILVELDTIRGQIVSVGAAHGAARGKELAGEVRALREQMGAVADGMSAAYEDAQ
jgi:hypothetical protein